MPQLYAFTLGLHSLVRWVVILVGVIALLRYAYGWLNSRVAFGNLDRQLAIGYAVVLTVQFVLGLVNLIVLLIIGGFRPGPDLEHTFYGLIITALAHLAPRRWGDADDRTRFRNLFFVVLVTIVLALFSVWRLRGSLFYGL